MSFGEYAQELIATANYITQDGKGILASDESTGKRFLGFLSLSLSDSHILCEVVYMCILITVFNLVCGFEMI